jgi:tetratricopeptide (TPR) repeat protein
MGWKALGITAGLLGSLLVGLAPRPAAAQTPPAAASPQELADEQVVKAAIAGVAGGGPLALKPRLDDLRRVASHAPALYPLVEQRGDQTIVRDESLSQADVLTLLLRAAVARQNTTIVRAYNTYGMARLMLASYAMETRQPQAALQELEAARVMQPDNGFLVSESAAAYELLGKPANALAVIQGWLPAHPAAPKAQQAILLRAEGYALVELRQPDQAEAAYKASLVLEPGHRGAQEELTFIAQMRKGAPAGGPARMITSDKAASGNEAAPPPPKP